MTIRIVTVQYVSDKGEGVFYSHDLDDEAIAELIQTVDRLHNETEERD